MEFVKGNWYKTQAGSIVKFSDADFGVFNASEHFMYNNLNRLCGRAGFGLINNKDFTELDILEIQEFLPDDHPDKIINKIKEDDNTQLIRILNEIR